MVHTNLNQLQILRYVKMNHFETHLMASSREVDSKLQDGDLVKYFYEKKAKWRMQC